jgi:hypothetical protein
MSNSLDGWMKALSVTIGAVRGFVDDLERMPKAYTDLPLLFKKLGERLGVCRDFLTDQPLDGIHVRHDDLRFRRTRERVLRVDGIGECFVASPPAGLWSERETELIGLICFVQGDQHFDKSGW